MKVDDIEDRFDGDTPAQRERDLRIIQVGGDHYQEGIQPFDYIRANKLDFFEGNVIKYITRYKKKNGIEDLLKAKHYLEEVINDYGKETNKRNS